MLISRLRKKLDGASPGSNLINTVRNGGLSVHRSCETADMILRMTFAARIGLIVRRRTRHGVDLHHRVVLHRPGPYRRNQYPARPGHIAALVELIERTPAPERTLVLRVASSEHLPRE